MIRSLKFLFVLIVITVLTQASVHAADNENFSILPKSKSDGAKWRIGYLEGGGYANYPLNLRALVEALSEMFWIEPIKLPGDMGGTDAMDLWNWLATHAESDYIEFVKDAFWSSAWDKEKRKKTRQTVINRLNNKKDIDLMLAMGTWAGQDLANNEHSVATIVMSSSNPLKSKIIKSDDDSGFDHLNARVDPTRYERQILIFYDIIGFKKLGMVFEQDTPDGRTYAAIDDVEKVAREMDFEIISCHAPFSDTPVEKAKAAVKACHDKLAAKVDAFYITTHRGVTLSTLPRLLKPLYEQNIPTFSQKGTLEVRHGVVLSIARAGFKFIGRFHGETIAKIFNGTRPRDLEQVFEDPPRIAINLKAAQQIGWDPPIDILGSADEIYETIEVFK